VDLPPTDAILLTGAAVRVVARPSGTEPKLKCYLQARRSLAESRADLVAAREAASRVLNQLKIDIAAALGLSV
jgi:phosphomannomutase